MNRRAKKSAAREPDYVTSMILQRPIEMVSPKKIAVLILLKRGWIEGYHTDVPPRFVTWHAARRKKPQYDRYLMRRPQGIPSPAGCLTNWRQIGCVKSVPVTGCYIKTTLVLTAKGEELLNQVAPEIMGAARAVVRATVWAFILQRRRYERECQQVAAMQAEATKTPRPGKKVKHDQHKGG